MSNIKTSLDANTAQLTAPEADWEIINKNIGGIDYRLFKNAPANLKELLNAGRVHGDKEFLVYEGERYSFDEFFAQADALASQLQSQYKLQAGDRVAIAMRNYPEWMIAFAAIVFAGGVPVPLNSWGQAAELEYALKDSGATIAVFDQQRYQHVADKLDVLAVQAIIARPEGDNNKAKNLKDLVEAGRGQTCSNVNVDAEDVAMIMYTSGTTGNPKGAASSHRNITQAIFNFEFGATCAAMTDLDPIMKMLGRGYDSKVLLSLPLFHVSGCHSVFLLSLRAGRSIVIMHKWDKVKALETIEKERITMISAVPTMLMEMLEAPEWDDFDTSSMFGFGAGGAAQPPRLSKQVYEKLPDSFPGTGYGMTESNACGFSAAGAVYAHKPKSTGCIAPIVDVRIVAEDGSDVEIQGLFACGEIASVSVHGANRLGGNSLLDLVVFGRATGLHLGETLNKQAEAKPATEADIERSLERYNRWENSTDGEDPAVIRKDLQQCMQNNFSVFREGKAMADGLEELKVIRERLKNAHLSDKSTEFNTQRIECLELENLMETAFATAVAANFRTESRGAHARFDFPDRDDEQWLCHSLYNPESESMTKRGVNMEPIHREAFPPKARTY